MEGQWGIGQIPSIVAPFFTRSQFIRSLADGLEPALGLIVLQGIHLKAGVGGTHIGFHASLSVNSTEQGCCVRVAAENLRISSNQFKVQIGQEFIAVETADSGQNSINGVIRKGSMDVCHPAFDGGRA